MKFLFVTRNSMLHSGGAIFVQILRVFHEDQRSAAFRFVAEEEKRPELLEAAKILGIRIQHEVRTIEVEGL